MTTTCAICEIASILARYGIAVVQIEGVWTILDPGCTAKRSEIPLEDAKTYEDAVRSASRWLREDKNSALGNDRVDTAMKIADLIRTKTSED